MSRFITGVGLLGPSLGLTPAAQGPACGCPNSLPANSSNPRLSFDNAGFQDRCLKPLGHPSPVVRTLTVVGAPARSRRVRGWPHLIAEDLTRDTSRCPCRR